jgi:hypothetical protein
MNFFRSTEEDIFQMFNQKHLSTEDLLKWSKLLEYDFFRIYCQHLILYSPSPSIVVKNKKKSGSLPLFKKNLYTKDMIDFLIELLNSGEKTKLQIVNEYRIPKTTFYKWLAKYNKNGKT